MASIAHPLFFPQPHFPPRDPGHRRAIPRPFTPRRGCQQRDGFSAGGQMAAFDCGEIESLDQEGGKVEDGRRFLGAKTTGVAGGRAQEGFGKRDDFGEVGVEGTVDGFVVGLEADGKHHEGDFIVHVHHRDAMEVLGAELASKLHESFQGQQPLAELGESVLSLCYCHFWRLIWRLRNEVGGR